MPAFAATTLKDSADADVAFIPTTIDSNGVALSMTDSASFDACHRLSTSTTLPKSGGTVIRTKQKVVIPVMDAVDTSKKLNEIIVNIEYVMPKNSPVKLRKDAAAYVSTLAKHAVTINAVENFESQY